MTGFPTLTYWSWRGILGIYAMLRQLQLRWSNYLVRMDNERLLPLTMDSYPNLKAQDNKQSFPVLDSSSSLMYTPGTRNFALTRGSSMEMLPRVPATKEAKSIDKGHSEDLPDASAGQPGQLGGPRSRPTDLREDNGDKRSDLRHHPHCRPESQTRGTQISTASTSQRQRPAALNLSTVSTYIPDASWTCWTPSDQLKYPGCTNRRLSIHLSLVL
ncbi:hypothetical protein SprV_0802623700 [Sparganum proliferum]